MKLPKMHKVFWIMFLLACNIAVLIGIGIGRFFLTYHPNIWDILTYDGLISTFGEILCLYYAIIEDL